MSTITPTPTPTRRDVPSSRPVRLPDPPAAQPQQKPAELARDGLGCVVAVDDRVRVVSPVVGALATVEHVESGAPHRLLVRRDDGRRTVVRAAAVIALRPVPYQRPMWRRS